MERPYGTLERAFKFRDCYEFVWAKEKIVYYNGKVVKTYQNAPVKDMCRYIQGQNEKQWNFYDILIKETHYSIYLDI